MLAFLHDSPAVNPSAASQHLVSDRKSRLLACASCRRIESLLTDDRCRHALDVSERFADGLASEQELLDACEGATAAAVGIIGGMPVTGSYSAGAHGVPSSGLRAIGLAARAAAEAASRLAPEAALSSTFEAAIERGAAIGTAWAVAALGAPARVRLLRELFGNPFRPILAARKWRTENVLAIANGVYADQAFERLPILADALQEVGCDAEELLAHCRSGDDHVLGCWALDAVLGKQ